MVPNFEAGAENWFGKGDIDEQSLRILTQNKGAKETICFLAEQWAEKYLKGFLTLHRKKFRHVHDLPYLIDLCSEIDNQISQWKEQSKALSDLYLAIRYPVDLPADFNTTTVVETAEEIVKFIKSKIKKGIE